MSRKKLHLSSDTDASYLEEAIGKVEREAEIVEE